MKKSRVLQTVLISVLAACTLFFGFISVMACIPEPADVEITEPIGASASRVSLESGYHIEVTGRLKNITDKPMTDARIEILLTNQAGEGELTLVMENQALYPKHELDVKTYQLSDKAYDVIKQVRITAGGEEIVAREVSQNLLASALIPVLVTAVFAFFLVRACRVRYYMMQEDRAERSENAKK